MTSFIESFQELRQLREDRQLSLQEVSQYSEFSSATLTNIENFGTHEDEDKLVDTYSKDSLQAWEASYRWSILLAAEKLNPWVGW
jgi:transcriptional regulator with XRE-family HTH domain